MTAGRRLLRAALALGVLWATAVSCGPAEEGAAAEERAAVGDGAEAAEAGASTAGTGLPTGCPTVADACTTSVEGVELTVSGQVRTAEVVGPAAGHPLSGIDRDAGVSLQLRDGAVLWLFGDTAARRSDGTLDYFVIGTAALAPAGSPATTADHVGPDGEPVPFAVPTQVSGPCPAPDQRPGMWPAAAVRQEVGPRDRVLVWLSNVCLGPGPTLVDRGTAVAEWWYEPGSVIDPSVPVRATLLNERLWPSGTFGAAAVAADDGFVYAYRCRSDDDHGYATSFGPCHVARAPVDGIADLDAYQDWDGEDFSAAAGLGREVEMPAGATWPYPPGGFSVVQHPVTGVYLMAYSPWPGETGLLDLRVATGPAGPWSPPVTVSLPECDDSIGTRTFGCYAGNLQLAFTTAGELGIGYYDSLVEPVPRRGAFRTAVLPVRLDRTN